jgi:hypothetical protein
MRVKKNDRTDIVGYVERIQAGSIAGWVFSRSGQPLHVTCRIGGQAYEVEPSWNERRDVSAQFGETALMSGFHIRPQAALQGVLSREGLREADVVLLANGQALPVDGQAFRRESPVCEPAAASNSGEKHQANIESFQDFMIRGWVVSNDGKPTTLAVTVNDKAVHCSIVRLDRKDVEEALGVVCPEAGFEIELAGYLWELIGDADFCEVRLFANGQSFLRQPLVLLRHKISEWIRRIAELREGQERQYFGLLALEHVRYGRYYSKLGQTNGSSCRSSQRLCSWRILCISTTMRLCEQTLYLPMI